ncbi:hypothetical protein HYY70_04800, partial [Candidatus Woesearchaeota archaeon]|nr:hypothetical protein [Candidatus Woesearchaeota archaeon]
NLTFNVTSFSVYSSEETPITSNLQSSGDQSANSSSGGGAPATAFFPNPGFSIDKGALKITLLAEEFKGEIIAVENTGNMELNFNVLADKLDNLLIINEPVFKLKPKEKKEIRIDLFAPEKFAGETYAGRLIFDAGLVKKTINVIIDIKRRQALFDIKVFIKDAIISQGDFAEADILLHNLGNLKPVDVTLFYSIRDFNGNDLTYDEETFAVESKKQINRKLRLPSDIQPGDYLFYSRLIYNNQTAVSSSLLTVTPLQLKAQKLTINQESINRLAWILFVLFGLFSLLTFLDLRRRQKLIVKSPKRGIVEIKNGQSQIGFEDMNKNHSLNKTHRKDRGKKYELGNLKEWLKNR